VAGCCECGDEPSGSCSTELVIYVVLHAVLYSIISKEELCVYHYSIFVQYV
jgi:hypothetical protein